MQADELKAARKVMGLSQEQMAEAIGLSRVLIGQMERGQAPIEKRTALAVAAILSGGTSTQDTRSATMNDAAKARFRQFADSWNDEDVVDDSGVTGADLKAIADMIEQVAIVPRVKFGQD
ncbi:helix-turn-helix transcriptional regulator [Sphingobium sp. R-7]|uniref:helix-turn-helix transcriptional regulator n=1 Tax=Sphingobium sp. R-7 TaxID=3375449 RepID=UPI00398ADC98